MKTFTSIITGAELLEEPGDRRWTQNSSLNHMIVIIPELDKQSHMIIFDRNRDPDSNYGGKYKEEAKLKAWYGHM